MYIHLEMCLSEQFECNTRIDARISNRMSTRLYKVQKMLQTIKAN